MVRNTYFGGGEDGVEDEVEVLWSVSCFQGVHVGRRTVHCEFGRLRVLSKSVTISQSRYHDALNKLRRRWRCGCGCDKKISS